MATLKRFTFLILTAIAITVSGVPPASAEIPLAQSPLFFPGALPPLNMLVMGRDHTLYYQAYNDASDLNGDGVLNVGYEPDKVTYFGYFDSFKCYSYSTTNGRFVPSSTTTDKKCASGWSGDFLNYVTTARIDALRKVLHGGKRSVDDTGLTVLERSYIPQDAHSWGKEYQSIERDGYDIREYTPLDLPNEGRYHLLANTSLVGTPLIPRMRVLQNSRFRVWEWVAIERPVAGDYCLDGRSDFGTLCTDGGATITNYTVRVEVCNASSPETNCKEYPDGPLKPTGLLHSYGESERMLFGLISGSYAKNTSGGVLRKPISSIANEINSDTGQFKTDVKGIIHTINSFQVVDFRSNGYAYYPGWQGAWVTTRAMNEGEFPDWGNPIGEMVYESLRYFMGKANPTSQFMPPTTGGEEVVNARLPSTLQLRLPAPQWDNPYQSRPWCTPATQLIISDVNPSYDTEFVPGSSFSSFSGDVSDLDATQEADAIWAAEYGGSSQHFIGESDGVYDGAPSEKTVTGLGNIRGLSPAEPTKQGGYYTSAVARYGYEEDLHQGQKPDKQNIQTFSVALASPLPKIEIPVGGNLVTVVPFGKSVSGLSINSARGQFQPTNTIVNFFVESFANTDPLGSDEDLNLNQGRPYVRFRINFEDVEQAADHDMDAIVLYELKVTAENQLDISLVSEYAAGGIEQHMGYVISGTTQDGVYLEVRDCDTANSNGINSMSGLEGTCRGNSPTSVRRYFLDTPPGILPGHCAQTPTPAVCNVDLPLYTTRTFNPDTTGSAATLLKDPLWYAAKYGSDGNDMTPGVTSPNYFLVTNASTLQQQLENAFQAILGISTSASAVATNSTRLGSESLIYQARFRSEDWTGELRAFPAMAVVTTTGDVAAEWDAGDLIPTPTARQILTLNPDTSATSRGLPFLWSDLAGTPYPGVLDIDPKDPTNIDGLGEARLNWLRGDASQEEKNDGPFRNRGRALGDIVNFNPVLVQADYFGYELLDASDGGDSYLSFYDNNRQNRPAVVYVGANDGMLHAFDAGSGVEKFAYIPGLLIPELNRLTDPDYVHRYYVDGQAYAGDAYLDGSWKTVLAASLGAGGRGVFALDVTDPNSFGPDNVLWEFTAADDSDLGHVMSAPLVVRMANGEWAAVFGNGYNSVAHQAYLFVVNLETGALIKKIPTGVGSGSEPNGLAPPEFLTDDTGTVTAAYAGDMLGNLWKFDLSSNDPDDWKSAFDSGGSPAPLFKAISQDGEAQPITERPAIIRHPEDSDSYLVLFGTGRYFAVNDNVIKTDIDGNIIEPVQSLYGIWDNNAPVSVTPSTRSTVLQEQSILGEPEIPALDGRRMRALSKETVDWTSKKGWFLDLESPEQGRQGERVVLRPVVRHDRVIFTSLIPSEDPCVFGGSGWVMEIDAKTGGRVGYTLFDINQDGAFDEGDFVEVDGEMVPLSGLAIAGIPSLPTIIRTDQGVEVRLVSTTATGGGQDGSQDAVIADARAAAAEAAATVADAASAAADAAADAATAVTTGDLAEIQDAARAAAAAAQAAADAAAEGAAAAQAVAAVDPTAARAAEAAAEAAAAAAEAAAAAAAASGRAGSTSDLAEAAAEAAEAAAAARRAGELADRVRGILDDISEGQPLTLIDRENLDGWVVEDPLLQQPLHWRQIQ